MEQHPRIRDRLRIVVTKAVLEHLRLAKQYSNVARRIDKHNELSQFYYTITIVKTIQAHEKTPHKIFVY